MNWEVFGIVAEMVSALGVIVTLGYLAIEVKRNRDATESAALDALTTGLNSINDHLMNDPELAQLYLVAMREPQSLNEVQGVRFTAMAQSYLNHFATVKKYHDSGLLPEEDWSSHCAAISQLMNSPGGKWVIDKVRVTPTIRSAISNESGVREGQLWGTFTN